MHPVLVYGAILLVGYLLDEKRADLRREAEREKRRLKGIPARRTKMVSEGRKRATGSALAATTTMIAAVKEERRAAARARDSLPWGSEERERAHELVVLLSQRLDALYEKKRKLHAKMEP